MSWGEVKKALNSTLGTNGFMPLDELIARVTGYYAQQTIYEYETPGNHEITIPYNCASVKITACGGGGGGGSASHSSGDYARGGGGGGGGAAIFEEIYAVNPISKITIKVGAGGTGYKYSSANSTQSTSGEATTIAGLKSGLLLLSGGAGASGKYGHGGSAGGAGGGRGGDGQDASGTTGGDAGADGVTGTGGTSPACSSTSYRSGGGGGGSIGNGGNGAYYSSGEKPATKGVRGGGGGGAMCYSSSSNYSAEDGGDGYCKVELILS